MKFSSHNEEKFIVFIKETNNIDEINNLGSSWSSWVKSQWDGRMEAISRSYIRYNFKKKNDRIRDTIFELTGKIQELVNEIHCMKDSRYFKMLNQYVVDYPTFPVNLRFPIFSRSWRNAKAVLWACQAATIGHHAFGTHMVYRETFMSIWRRLQHLFRKRSTLWVSNVSEHTPPHVMSESQTQLWIRDASQERQSEIHSTPVRGDSERIMEQTSNECRFQIFILTNSPRKQRSLVGT